MYVTGVFNSPPKGSGFGPQCAQPSLLASISQMPNPLAADMCLNSL